MESIIPEPAKKQRTRHSASVLCSSFKLPSSSPVSIKAWGCMSKGDIYLQEAETIKGEKGVSLASLSSQVQGKPCF